MSYLEYRETQSKRRHQAISHTDESLCKHNYFYKDRLMTNITICQVCGKYLKVNILEEV